MKRWMPLALAAALLAPAAANGWGQNGHRILSEIAERHLGPGARAAVADLLEGDGLAEASTWMDEIRSDPSWDCAAPFHYVTVPPGSDYPDGGVRAGDAGQALVHYLDVLTDPESDRARRQAALKIVVHLVGDLHQPLHVGRGCDRGGNSIAVEFFGEEEDLHHVLDTGLIERQNLSFTEFVAFLGQPSDADLEAAEQESPLDWMRDAQGHHPAIYTCDTADRCPCFCGDCADDLSVFGGCEMRQCRLIAAGTVRLGYGYVFRLLPRVERQLVVGGLRLAALLDWALAEEPRPPKAYREFSRRIREIPGWNEAMRSCPRPREAP